MKNDMLAASSLLLAFHPFIMPDKFSTNFLFPIKKNKAGITVTPNIYSLQWVLSQPCQCQCQCQFSLTFASKGQFPWLKIKFPDFSLILKIEKLFFPDHFRTCDNPTACEWWQSFVLADQGRRLPFFSNRTKVLVSRENCQLAVHRWKNKILGYLSN